MTYAFVPLTSKKTHFYGNPLTCDFDPSDQINDHGVCMSYCYFLPRREKYLARLVLQTCLKKQVFFQNGWEKPICQKVRTQLFLKLKFFQEHGQYLQHKPTEISQKVPVRFKVSNAQLGTLYNDNINPSKAHFQ